MKNTGTMSETVARISRPIYVDDIAYGIEDEEQAYQLYLESKSIQVRWLQSCNKLDVSADED